MKKNTVLIIILTAWLLVGCQPYRTSTPAIYMPPTRFSVHSATPLPTESIRIIEPTLIPTEAIRAESATPTHTAAPLAIATALLDRASPSPTKARPTASPTQTASPTPTTALPIECQADYPTRLYLGAYAVVSDEPPLPNRLRSEPSAKDGESSIIGWIQPGEEIVLLQGPICAEGWVWWKAASLSSGQSGWTSEGDEENYWLLPLHPQAAGANAADNTVVLSANQVHSAVDIEAAIKRATLEGSRPGTVILDGRKGAFVYTGDDRSINLFVSNLVLRSVNGAVIKNCGDGVFFDNFPLKNIVVAGIEFICEGEGVAASGAFDHVTLYQNTFRAGRSGVGLGGASSNWLIVENVIEAGWGGIEINGAKKIVIADNNISGNTGIVLRQCSHFQIQKNVIQASYQGILLAQESWKNIVQMNTIRGVSHSGIALEPGVTSNQILDNKVSCAPGENCLTIDATPEVAEMNTIHLISAENLVYSNDFENSAGMEWSHHTLEFSPTGRKFLGQFGNGAVTLKLNDLPDHREIRVVFEVYILKSWDGNINPDVWKFKVDGQTWLLTTFDNQDFYADHSQAYPDIFKEGSHPPRTGAKENNTLGYKFDNRLMDSIYLLSFTIPHTSANLELTFSAEGLTSDFSDESWGIDNIAIYTIK